ncbi:MAG: T9SS type B sorting domain-containing protein, partial [Cytophagaceae bacterium]
GGLLHGKCYMLSVTWNAPLEAFEDKEQFFHGVGVDGVYLAQHKANQFIGLDTLPTFMCNDVIKQPDVIDGGSIFIPEGFSPNGDGINDYFVIQGTPAAATIELEIFNRWGHRVYANANYKNDWGGQPNQGINTTANQGLPDGTYFYVVRISDGREYVRFLTIAR